VSRENYAAFDRLPAKVRQRLTETAFEMTSRDFDGMDERMALSFINEIEREVRSADRRDKSRFFVPISQKYR
jgi:hypothetical protein